MPNANRQNNASSTSATNGKMPPSKGTDGHVRSYGMGKGAVRSASLSGGVDGSRLGNSKPGNLQSSNSQSAASNSQGKKKRGAAFWIAIVIAVICLIIAGVLAFNLFGAQTPSKRQGDLGQLEGKTQEEIQAELDRVVDEGMFNISIASTVQFESGTSEGELRIENVPSNHYLMRVVVTRDDTGEQIYETDLIEPNYHIQADTLDVDLSAGVYECTATFHAYDQQTEEEVGQAAAKIEITVAS
ncbi:hypothetical protein [Adlercreutzia sp. ZJ154]|uniref:hypothetical protein n=1 Tax=Adlercreutzia sp. ZJ154 TaxID=2709790 RepID=UPI0013EDD020|nr:hypothetical protein [Adlercreutzia sp. ZJ154]